jgi:diadenosine tetraphosphatase ApaH/serine/threonine PP2A family protein phosphatase
VKRDSTNTTAVIGDVHACADELRELLDVLVELRAVTRVVLTGDLLTKGPDPAGTVGVIDSFAEAGFDVTSVCGNQDLRTFRSLERLAAGTPLDRISRSDRGVYARLVEGGMVETAWRRLADTISRVEETAGHATVVHAGIRPGIGLANTDAHDKIHLRPEAGGSPWWTEYAGEDGLIVCGHKPVDAPIRSVRDARPVAVNVDTGCVAGGSLTAYLVEDDEFIAVESRKVRGRATGGRFIEPTSIEPRPVRSRAG